MSKNSERLGIEDHENCVQIGREITKSLTSEYCEQVDIMSQNSERLELEDHPSIHSH